MKRGLLVISAAVLLAASPRAMNAQLWTYPETLLGTPRAFERARGDSVELLSWSAFSGEASGFIGNEDETHRWCASVGGSVELLGGARWNLVFESAISLIADPGNNIGFNPRALFWEEGILFGLRNGADVWQFGLQHRCKHDIDNIELLRVTGREEERALIYSSLVARWSRDAFIWSGVDIEPMAELHGYVFVQDQRFPVSTRELLPGVEDNLGAARLRIEASVPLLLRIRAGILLDARSTVRMEHHRSTEDADLAVLIDVVAVELYIEAQGQAAGLRGFLRYARLSDTYIPPFPSGASLVSLGFRIGS